METCIFNSFAISRKNKYNESWYYYPQTSNGVSMLIFMRHTRNKDKYRNYQKKLETSTNIWRKP